MTPRAPEKERLVVKLFTRPVQVLTLRSLQLEWHWDRHPAVWSAIENLCLPLGNGL